MGRLKVNVLIGLNAVAAEVEAEYTCEINHGVATPQRIGYVQRLAAATKD